MRKSVKVCIFIYAILLLSAFGNHALCQQKKVTVVFGDGEKITLSDWSFVYHLKRGDEALVKGEGTGVLKKKSHNLFLKERYDEEEGKKDFGKGKEISIDYEKLSSIEYLWNWGFASSEKVIITLTDGTKLERVRLGPIATSFFGDEKFLYGKGIYLEGNYTLSDEKKRINYNLDKWLRGAVPKKEIIVKIIF